MMLPVLPLPTCSAIPDALPAAIGPEPETQAAAPLFSLREVTTAGREATEQKPRSLDDMRLDERWHALLWNHLDVAVGKAEDGLDNLQRLSKFVGKRVAAEKEVASSLLDMCQASKWGLKRDELLDVLRETGRMNEAWSMLVEKTKETCNAHMVLLASLPAPRARTHNVRDRPALGGILGERLVVHARTGSRRNKLSSATQLATS